MYTVKVTANKKRSFKLSHNVIQLIIREILSFDKLRIMYEILDVLRITQCLRVYKVDSKHNKLCRIITIYSLGNKVKLLFLGVNHLFALLTAFFFFF